MPTDGLTTAVLLSIIYVAAAQSAFDWSAIDPTPDLQYHDCFSGFKCARLQVPLDWQNSSDPRTVALAITALPATVPKDDPSFGGSIIAIPGGPGSSGVDFILGFGPTMKLIVDRKKHYEVLSYDPRGVGFSTPTVDCFGGDMSARTDFLVKQFESAPSTEVSMACGGRVLSTRRMGPSVERLWRRVVSWHTSPRPRRRGISSRWWIGSTS